MPTFPAKVQLGAPSPAETIAELISDAHRYAKAAKRNEGEKRAQLIAARDGAIAKIRAARDLLNSSLAEVEELAKD